MTMRDHVGHWMGWRSSLAAVVVAGALLGGGSPAQAAEPVQSESVEVYAHRGAGGTTPENTRVSFEQAIANRADFLETDVQRSADGALVIIHDATLARTTDVEQKFPDRAPWNVADFTLAEIRTLDAGSWYDEDFAGERIMTLGELLELARGRAGVDLELKSPQLYPGIEADVAAELARHPGWTTSSPTAGRLVVTSFDAAVLHRFHDLLPEVEVAAIGYEVPDAAALSAIAEWADGYVPDFRLLTQEGADRVGAAGLDLIPWTIDSPEFMEQAIDMGADGLITNFDLVGENVTRGKDPLPDANGVVVDDVVENPSGDDVQYENGEYIAIRNTTDAPVDVTGWTLRDQASNLFRIGDGYVIPAGGVLRVYTGPGPNSADRYYNGNTRSFLNNTGGEAVAIYDAERDVVDLFAYLV